MQGDDFFNVFLLARYRKPGVVAGQDSPLVDGVQHNGMFCPIAGRKGYGLYLICGGNAVGVSKAACCADKIEGHKQSRHYRIGTHGFPDAFHAAPVDGFNGQMSEKSSEKGAEEEGEVGVYAVDKQAKHHAEAGRDHEANQHAGNGEGKSILRGFARTFAVKKDAGGEEDGGIEEPPKQHWGGHGMGEDDRTEEGVHGAVEEHGNTVSCVARKRRFHITGGEQDEQRQPGTESNGADDRVEHRAAADEEKDHQPEQGQRVKQKKKDPQPESAELQGLLQRHAENQEYQEAEQLHRQQRYSERRDFRGQAAEKQVFPAYGQGMEEIHAAFVMQIAEQRHGENQGEQP